MDAFDQYIAQYEKYRSLMSEGILNAAAEQSLAASIKLTDSSISFKVFEDNFIGRFGALFEKFQKKYGHRTDVLHVKTFAKSNPEFAELFAMQEIGVHEAIHALQKHAYRSVFNLVDALQSIESWEVKLFLAHAGSGGKWSTEDSFLSCLKRNDQFDPAEGIARLIARHCETVLEAGAIKANGLNIFNLIEGQAFVGAKLAIKMCDGDEDVQGPELYTKAWKIFRARGGKEPILFYLMVSAALRYGDIDTDRMFKDFRPHPVDVFDYLLNFIPEIQALISSMDNPFSRLGLIPPETVLRDIEKVVAQKIAQGICPVDSVDELHCYVKHKMTDECYDSIDEKEEMERRNEAEIFSAFEFMESVDRMGDEAEHGVQILLILSKAIAKIVERAYSRVAEPMNAEFDRHHPREIGLEVGFHFRAFFPDYWKEESVIRMILDQNFCFGKVMGFFIYELEKRIKIRPFDHLDEMTHEEYGFMVRWMDVIKNLLAISKWDGGNVLLPYCCEEHGRVSADLASPEFFDTCGAEDSSSKMLKLMMGRSIESFFD